MYSGNANSQQQATPIAFDQHGHPFRWVYPNGQLVQIDQNGNPYSVDDRGNPLDPNPTRRDRPTTAAGVPYYDEPRNRPLGNTGYGNDRGAPRVRARSAVYGGGSVSGIVTSRHAVDDRYESARVDVYGRTYEEEPAPRRRRKQSQPEYREEPRSRYRKQDEFSEFVDGDDEITNNDKSTPKTESKRKGVYNTNMRPTAGDRMIPLYNSETHTLELEDVGKGEFSIKIVKIKRSV